MPQQHNQKVRSTEILVTGGSQKLPSLLNVLGFQNLTRFRGGAGGGQNKNLSREKYTNYFFNLIYQQNKIILNF